MVMLHFKTHCKLLLDSRGQARNRGGEAPLDKLHPLEKYVGHILKPLDIV